MLTAVEKENIGNTNTYRKPNSPIAPRFLMLTERGIKRNRLTQEKFGMYCKKQKRENGLAVFNRLRPSYAPIDRYLFHLVKSSVAARHFFLNTQARFAKKLTDYAKKIPLPDELRGVGENQIMEIVEICLPEYWEQYHNVINSLRAHIRSAITELESDFGYPTRKRGSDMRARCLTQWFQGTSEVALQLEFAILGSIPDDIDADDELRDSIISFKGFRHQLVEDFKVAVARSCGKSFDELDEHEVDIGIESLSLQEKQQLARSRFCFVWAIFLHSSTKLVGAGATIQRFNECVRLSLEVFLLQNLYVDLWCSKCQDPMWMRDEEGSPMYRLVRLVQRDRDHVQQDLLERALESIGDQIPNISVDLMYNTVTDSINPLELPGIGIVDSVLEI